MSSAITAVVGGAVVGGIMANKAAKTQAKGATEAARVSGEAGAYAADLQNQQWLQQQENQAPWLEQGTAAIEQLGPGVISGEMSKPFSMADYQQDPGYQFRLSEGVKALDRSASAKGNLLSGSALKGVTRFGQDLASQEYQNAYNRYTGEQATKYNQLANLAGLGQTTANTLGAAGQIAASNLGNIAQGTAATQGSAALAKASAQASAYQGYGNALSGGITGLSQIYQNRSQPQQQSSGWVNPDTGRTW